MKYKVFIDGQEGTTGLKIRKRFQERRDLELLPISEKDRKNIEVRLERMKEADITFLCLPDAASREIILKADESMRILDTSTAHRTNDKWVYGLPELCKGQRDRIKSSNRVAVPGCHATGFIVLTKPLIALGIAEKDYPFTCQSITGYSGGGKNMISQYDSADRSEALKSPRLYGLTQQHKHLPEMTAITGIDYPPVFNPTVADYFSGMLVTVPLHSRMLNKKMTSEALRQEFAGYYEQQSMIRVMGIDELPEDGFLASDDMAEKDNLQIFVMGNAERIVLAARYDNLGKGASGAAIQCMNIMLDLPEETGLTID
jgi:N-acetyl-gamma-glutamyl-phosphate reductase, uncommon form